MKYYSKIDAKNYKLDSQLKEIWNYKDLILIFVKRNYSTRYKQTILGPLWLIINPLFTVFTYTIVFGGLAKLSTDGVNGAIFYLCGIIIWTFFSNTFMAASGTFTGNVGLFSKIYFPRMVVPISSMLTNVLDFLVQFLLLIVLSVILYFNGECFNPNYYLILVPLMLLQLSLLGIGLGILVSSLTTKYKDLAVLVGFGLQIWMYGSPVIYSMTLVPEKLKSIYLINPVAPALLFFKYAYLGIGEIPWLYWGISWGISIGVFFMGLLVFNKVDRTFLDTV